MSVVVARPAHPLLDAGLLEATFPTALADTPAPAALEALLADPARAPLRSDDVVREHVRALLRQGGFKPSGRSKPASEYLVAAERDGRFPRINPAVDLCNVVSLASGLPISLVDLDLTRGALALRVLPPGTSYVFNPSGQTIDAGGLLALCDDDGACGTPVKDAQRTKTSATTRRTLVVVWGTVALPGRTTATLTWYRELLGLAGADVADPVDARAD
ncbi:MAG: hypothetical protein KBF28_00465 [Gemmatimonadales bacterium]|nr:hypothetical protein [Gemmatimonadales bacterium]